MINSRRKPRSRSRSKTRNFRKPRSRSRDKIQTPKSVVMNIGQDLCDYVSGNSPSIIGCSSTTTFAPYACNTSLLIGSKKGLDISVDGMVKVNDEKFNENELGASVIIKSDNGIWVNTEENKFANLVEVLNEWREMKTMIEELYWAPPYGPGYLKSKGSFESNSGSFESKIESNSGSLETKIESKDENNVNNSGTDESEI